MNMIQVDAHGVDDKFGIFCTDVYAWDFGRTLDGRVQ